VKFMDEPTLRMLRNGDWQLASPLTYITHDCYIVAIPAGFITDLASIPRALHSLIPQHGDHSLAAIVHDYLYATQGTTRKAADEIFLNALEDSGVSWIKRNLLYAGVRVGGWVAWNARAKAREEDQKQHMKDNGL
jgi:hypothetical protein